MDATIKKLWENYYAITPTVKKIKQALSLGTTYNSFCDHIAFRTISTNKNGITQLNKSKYGIERLSEYFMEQGYSFIERYYFKEKNVRAIHLEKENCPKIFISELILNECSSFLKSTLVRAFNRYTISDDTLISGRKWDVNYKTYKLLKNESEYAAWLYIHGHRVNHFTISVNELKNYSIEIVCTQLRTSGIKLNASGGTIKGSSRLGLKQASTMADEISVKFEDLKLPVKVASCYVEFAERFTVENRVFNGIVTKSANKTFKSTNRVA